MNNEQQTSNEMFEYLLKEQGPYSALCNALRIGKISKEQVEKLSEEDVANMHAYIALTALLKTDLEWDLQDAFEDLGKIFSDVDNITDPEEFAEFCNKFVRPAMKTVDSCISLLRNVTDVGLTLRRNREHDKK